MSVIEIILVSSVGLFAIIAILSMFIYRKKAKSIKNKVKVSQTNESGEPKADSPKEDKGFKITKKGVVKIKKESTKRDSRTERIIEKVDVKKETSQKKSKGFDNFDDFLGKLKEVGDPDELDDETFDQMFGIARNNEDFDYADDGEDFVPATTPKVSSNLQHFTIDGSHLNLDKSYEGLPVRRPTISSRIEFADRITGRYENITAGDISNRIQVSKAITGDEGVAVDEPQNDFEEELSDEDIFSKIMERRRRELGIDNPSSKEEVKNIDPKTLVIASAIIDRRHAKK